MTRDSVIPLLGFGLGLLGGMCVAALYLGFIRFS